MTSTLRRRVGSAASMLLLVVGLGVALAAPHEVHQLERDMAVLRESVTVRLEQVAQAEQREFKHLQSDIDDKATNANARIDALSARIGDLGFYIAFYSVLIAVIVVFIGLLTFFKARDAANDWLSENGPAYLNAGIDKRLGPSEAAFNERLDALEARLAQRGEEVIEGERKNLASAGAKMLGGLGGAASPGPVPGTAPVPPDASALSAEERQAVEREAAALAARPETLYRYADWRNRAVAAFAEGRPDEALGHIRRSAEAAATDAERAQARTSTAVVLAQAGRPAEALQLFAEVERDFAASPEPAVVAQVVKAAASRAWTLAQQSRLPDAMALWDEIEQRYRHVRDPLVLTELAGAIYNHGAYLQQHDQFAAAAERYERLDADFAHLPGADLRGTIASALYNLALLRTARRDTEGARTCYAKIVDRYAADTDPPLQKTVADARERLRELPPPRFPN